MTVTTEGDDVRTRTRYEAPCGSYVSDDASKTIRHAARCARCSAAARADDATGTGPTPNSEQARRNLVERVDSALEVYASNITRSMASIAPGARQRQVERLASVIGMLEVALHHETGGRAGDLYSSGHKVLGRYGTGQARD